MLSHKLPQYPFPLETLQFSTLILNCLSITIIDSISQPFQYVSQLHLNHNLLQTLRGIQSFRNLEVLHFNHNHVKDIRELKRVKNRFFTKSLSYIGNPIEGCEGQLMSWSRLCDNNQKCILTKNQGKVCRSQGFTAVKQLFCNLQVWNSHLTLIQQPISLKNQQFQSSLYNNCKNITTSTGTMTQEPLSESSIQSLAKRHTGLHQTNKKSHINASYHYQNQHKPKTHPIIQHHPNNSHLTPIKGIFSREVHLSVDNNQSSPQPILTESGEHLYGLSKSLKSNSSKKFQAASTKRQKYPQYPISPHVGENCVYVPFETKRYPRNHQRHQRREIKIRPFNQAQEEQIKIKRHSLSEESSFEQQVITKNPMILENQPETARFSNSPQIIPNIHFIQAQRFHLVKAFRNRTLIQNAFKAWQLFLIENVQNNYNFYKNSHQGTFLRDRREGYLKIQKVLNNVYDLKKDEGLKQAWIALRIHSAIRGIQQQYEGWLQD